MASRRRYAFTCDRCGATADASAAWKLRHPPLLCLACIRVQNGWRCPMCGTGDPHHCYPCNPTDRKIIG